MPTSKEITANRPLKSEELAKIVLADVADILDGSGFFRGQIAYGRVAYEVRVTLHIDNPSYPTDITNVRSKPRSKQEVEAIGDLYRVGRRDEPCACSPPRSGAGQRGL